jgi:DNA-binding Lrp family transcriptional regulator
MVLLETADSSPAAAALIAERTPETVSGTAKLVYQALLIPALENARERGYSPKTGRVTFHCPAEIVAKALGISRMTLWRAVQVLQAEGLIDNRAHKANLACRGGRVRNTGSVWQVRLTPNHGSKAKLSYEEMHHTWRPNFNDEVRQGRGSHAAVRKHALAVKAARGRNVTYKRDFQEIDLDLLLTHSVDSKKHLAPVDTSVRNKPKNAVLEVLLDVASAAPGRDTVQRVDLAALALATALADHGSVNFYQKLVWGALRASQQGLDVFPMLYQMAIRARVDLQEGFSRKGGAVFVSRLKQTQFWDALARPSGELTRSS